MSDENPHSSQGSAKSWFERLFQVFTAEPQNRDQLVEVISDAEERDLIDPDTKQMIEGVLDVSERRVRDIMIPRSQMVTLDLEKSLSELLPILIETKHSRYPVITEDKDHVEGILLAKDLLGYALSAEEKDFTLQEILRPVAVVPESKRLDTLLKEFRSKRYHMAIVVDEYGGVSGLVTIEDILEIIVGEIQDEHDEDEEQSDIRKISKHTFLVAALTELEEFNEYFETSFNEEDADTIGGIVLHAFGHMPSPGETAELDGFVFKVVNADSRRLHLLQVTIPKSHTQSATESV